MNSYDDKHVWIIGASSGIGYALAVELARRGASLILSARSEEKLEHLNEKLGNKHTVLPLDVSDSKKLTKAAKSIPKVDSVVFLAALYAPHSKKTKDIDFIHDMIRINIGGAYNTVNAVLPIFEAQGFGQIVLCGSVAGYRGLPYGQPYCSTKGAISNYAESLYVELSPKNVDVKLISPGFVRTPLTDKNTFPMPMMIEADQAAKAIAKGLISKRFEIHFPKKFTYIMKLLKIMPSPLYLWLAKKIKI